MLATILFTDIVNSTTRAIELGDRRWRELLDSHDRLAAQVVERHRGKLVKSTGDGILATFDLVAGAGLKFAERGSFDLKGIPGAWELFAVQ